MLFCKNARQSTAKALSNAAYKRLLKHAFTSKFFSLNVIRYEYIVLDYALFLIAIYAFPS